MLVEIENITKSFPSPDGTSSIGIFNNLSLRIDLAQALAITGPSGSGKSTLLNIIGTLDRPDKGAVRFATRDITGMTEKELARLRNREIGFIFQMHHLLPQCSVLENVLIPTLAGYRTPDADKRARRLLARVGLTNRLDHRPAQLSGGECQRVAVVRALINSPRILLADEPTGSLDHHAAASLGELLMDLNNEEGVALVVVTHSTELAKIFPRVLRLHDGGLQPAN